MPNIQEILHQQPHPLKNQFTKSGVCLWQLQRFLGGRPSESRLSRMMNGIIPMSPAVEAGVREVLHQLGGGSSNG